MVLQNESYRETGVLLHYNESPLEIPLDLSVSSRSLQSPSPASYELPGRAKLLEDEDDVDFAPPSVYEDEVRDRLLKERTIYGSIENVTEIYNQSVPKPGLRLRPAEDILKKECLTNDCLSSRSNYSNHSSREHSREPYREHSREPYREHSREPFREHHRDHSREPLHDNHREILGETFGNTIAEVYDKYRRGRSPVASKRGHVSRTSVSPASLYSAPEFENLSLKAENSAVRNTYRIAQHDLPLRSDSSKLYLAVTGADPNYIKSSNRVDYYPRSRSPSLPNERSVRSRSQSPYNFTVDQSYRRGRSPPSSTSASPNDGHSIVSAHGFYQRCPTPSYHSEHHIRPPTPVSPPCMDTSDSTHSTYDRRTSSGSASDLRYQEELQRSPKLSTMKPIFYDLPKLKSKSEVSRQSTNQLLNEDEDNEVYDKGGVSSSSSPDDFRETTSSPDSDEKATLRRAYKKDMLKRFRK